MTILLHVCVKSDDAPTLINIADFYICIYDINVWCEIGLLYKCESD